MTTALQVSDRVITNEEIIPLLTSYQLLPQLLHQIIIDRAIARIECTPEEKASACKLHNGLTSATVPAPPNTICTFPGQGGAS